MYMHYGDDLSKESFYFMIINQRLKENNITKWKYTYVFMKTSNTWENTGKDKGAGEISR